MMPMRPIARVFDRCRKERRAALIAYIAAGDPAAWATEALAKGALRGGADILEIGVPFSDPLADGPIIQAAYTRSLQAGTTVHSVLDSVERIRQTRDVPIVLMTSWNPVRAYGPERFCRRAESAGAAGVLVPDLLPEDSALFRKHARASGLDTIHLAAPGMSQERLETAATLTAGFLYLVSRRGVTGPGGGIGDTLEAEVRRAREACSQPIAVGFGVAAQQDAARVARCADGVIVGSALVKEGFLAFQQAVAENASEQEAVGDAAKAVERQTAKLAAGVMSARKMKGRGPE